MEIMNRCIGRLTLVLKPKKFQKNRKKCNSCSGNGVRAPPPPTRNKVCGKREGVRRSGSCDRDGKGHSGRNRNGHIEACGGGKMGGGGG